MTTNQTIDGVPRRAVEWAFERLEICQDQAFQTCECEECEQCGKMPDECSGTDCAKTCQCSTCDHCSNELAMSELRALLDADKVNNRQMGLMGFVEAHPIKPAAQPQGEPVGYVIPGDMPAQDGYTKTLHPVAGGKYTFPLYAEQPAPVAVVPDGYCIMPRQLTAENGAKSLLLGEFKLLVTMECPECCELEEPTEGCSICDGEGEYGQKHTIPWDQIKFIYSKAVSGLAKKAESAKS